MVDLLEGQAFTDLGVYTVSLAVTARESRTQGREGVLQVWAANTPATLFPHGLDRRATMAQAPQMTLVTTGNSALGLGVKA